MSEMTTLSDAANLNLNSIYTRNLSHHKQELCEQVTVDNSTTASLSSNNVPDNKREFLSLRKQSSSSTSSSTSWSGSDRTASTSDSLMASIISTPTEENRTRALFSCSSSELNEPSPMTPTTPTTVFNFEFHSRNHHLNNNLNLNDEIASSGLCSDVENEDQSSVKSILNGDTVKTCSQEWDSSAFHSAPIPNVSHTGGSSSGANSSSRPRRRHRRSKSLSLDVIHFHNLDNVAISNLYCDSTGMGNGKKMGKGDAGNRPTCRSLPTSIILPSAPLDGDNGEFPIINYECAHEWKDKEIVDINVEATKTTGEDPLLSPATPNLLVVLCPAPDSIRGPKPWHHSDSNSDQPNVGNQLQRDDRRVFLFGDNDVYNQDNEEGHGGLGEDTHSCGTVAAEQAALPPDPTEDIFSYILYCNSIDPNSESLLEDEMGDMSLEQYQKSTQPVSTCQVESDSRGNKDKDNVDVIVKTEEESSSFPTRHDCVINALSHLKLAVGEIEIDEGEDEDEEVECDSSTFADLFRRIRTERDSSLMNDVSSRNDDLGLEVERVELELKNIKCCK